MKTHFAFMKIEGSLLCSKKTGIRPSMKSYTFFTLSSLESILVLYCHVHLGLPSELNPRNHLTKITYAGLFKSFRTGRLEREPQMLQLFATRCSFIAIL